jgi:hypothetical protein
MPQGFRLVVCLSVVAFGAPMTMAKDGSTETKSPSASATELAWDSAGSARERNALTESRVRTIDQVVEAVSVAMVAAEDAEDDARLRCVRLKLASLTALQKASSIANVRLQASLDEAPDQARSEFVRISLAADEALDIGVETQVCSNIRTGVPASKDPQEAKSE